MKRGGGNLLARAAGLVSAATMLSRVLGLVREQLFAALMGATMLADAFVVAFRIPNLLRDLFAEGALSQAFVPTFKASLKHDGEAAAYQLGNKVAGTLMVIIGAITLIAAVFAPAIVEVMASDFADTPGKAELTIKLTRIMLPFLAVVSLSAVAMGMLNAQARFAVPALAPATFNLVSITGGVLLYATGWDGTQVVIGWSVATLLGGAGQLLIQLPSLWRTGWRPRLGFDLLLKDPQVRRVARLMLPAVGGLAAVQVNVLVNTIFATQEEGAAAWLNYAFRFLQLPIGVFGVAIATVSTTRYADAAADGRLDTMAEQATEGLRLVAFLTVPATVGLVLLGEPIIALIYQHGAFELRDTLATAAALDLYVVGLVAYAGVKVIAPAFFAIDASRIPMAASIAAVIGNVTLNILLHPIYGYRILALGTALAATLNFAVLYLWFCKKVSPIHHGRLLGHLLRVAIAATVMGAAVWGCHVGLAEVMAGPGLADRAARALVPIAAGIIVYAGASYALGIDELSHYARRLRRKLSR